MRYGSQVRSLFIRMDLTRPMLSPISIESDSHLASDVDSHFKASIIARFHFAIWCLAMPS
jgi:hypothetical protein